MPTGKVKWYDVDKGFGFLTRDEGGEDVFVRANALPAGTTALKPGARVEYGIVAGRKGDQALQVRVLDPLPSLNRTAQRPAEELHGLIEDMIKLIETKVQPALRRGKYPDRKDATTIAEMLRAIARELEQS